MAEALLLVGHGSHLSPDSSAPILNLAEQLRARARFAEVGVAFWKEEPSLSRAFDQFSSNEVTVVPVFISEGYFTRQVLPRELRLAGPLTERDGRIIRYTAAIGSDPAFAQIIVERALEAGAGPQDTVVVLGHGTPRNPNSERNIYDRAGEVRAMARFAHVEALFLEQDPNIMDVFALVPGNRIVVVPFFVADGWHVGETIPGDLNITGGELREGDRLLRYTKPAGTHPAVADIVVALAASPTSPISPTPPSPSQGEGRGEGRFRPQPTSPTNPNPKSKIQNPKSPPTSPISPTSSDTPFSFGQLRITRLPDGKYRLEGPPAPGSPAILALSPGQLHEYLRYDDAGRYRPLSGATNMRSGWNLTCDSADLPAYLNAAYPLATAHVDAYAAGTLATTPLAPLLARQSGRYESAGALTVEAGALALRALCGNCVRQPVWEGSDGAALREAAIPCPEPCGVLLELCREAQLWTADPPEPSSPDPAVPFARFDLPGNETRERYIAIRSGRNTPK